MKCVQLASNSLSLCSDMIVDYNFQVSMCEIKDVDVFACSTIGVVASNLTLGMGGCQRFVSVCVVLCR
jgi:hypothetical protein